MRSIGGVVGAIRARQPPYRVRSTFTRTGKLAGTAGLEPANAGIKIPCLTNLATSQRSRERHSSLTATFTAIQLTSVRVSAPRKHVAWRFLHRNS